MNRYLPMAVVAIAAAIAFPNWPWGVRFVFPVLNYWFIALIWTSMPIALGLALWPIPRKARWISISVMSIVVGAPCLAAAVLVILFGPRGIAEEDPGFALTQSELVGESYFRLYQTNCGATCGYGSALRREIDTRVGIKFVSLLWEDGDAEESALVVTGQQVKVVGPNGIRYEYVR